MRGVHKLALPLWLAFIPGAVQAQSTGLIDGTVQDPAGAALANAKVRLTQALTGFERLAVTNDAGGFTLANLPLQPYELEIRRDGFETVRRPVAVRSTVPVRLEIHLDVAAQREELDVLAIAGRELVDPEATGTRAELHRSAIEKIPTPPGARGLEGLLLSLPGFAANANGAIHPRGAHNQMTYVIDGMPISDQFTGSFATSIDPSLVQTLELYTGDIPAEFGSKVSGVANITTRSGFDVGRPFFGSAELGGGGFDLLTSTLQGGGARRKLGWFAAVSGVKSNRFLDSPSLDNLHNGGNAERAFSRFDYRATERDIFRLNVMAGRSSFQLANLRSQHAAGQQQRRLLRDVAASLGYVRLLTPAATFDTTLSYRRADARLSPSAGDTPVTASLSRRLTTFSALNRFNVLHGRHNLRLGLDYQRFPVVENFAFALTSPEFNHPEALGFNPNLLPYDLTRGGDWFFYRGRGAGRLASAFLQDRIRVGPLALSLGLRYDSYRFLVHGVQLQPRLGVAWNLRETGTVFRISYNRNYQTPPNENLLLANSAEASRLAPPDVQRGLDGGVILMRPQRQNVYEAGVEQNLGGRARLNVAYYHKDSHDLQDNDNFLNTGVIFPTSLARSNVNGFEARLALPEGGRVFGSIGATHYHVVVTPPFTGGLFLGSGTLDVLSAGPFVIDHDQELGLSGLTGYRGRRWWTAWRLRYDSGLVSNPSDPAEVAADPDYADQLPYVDLLGDPPRVRPRTIVDVAVGYEHFRGDRRDWEVVLQASNLTNQTALYNFQSVFVGTRVVQPRTLSAKWRWIW